MFPGSCVSSFGSSPKLETVAVSSFWAYPKVETADAFKVLGRFHFCACQNLPLNFKTDKLADFYFQNFIFITKNPDFVLICSVCSFRSVKIGFSKRPLVVTSEIHQDKETTSWTVTFLKTCSFLKGNKYLTARSSMK